MTDDGILIRYKDDEIVGITILEASKRINKKQNILQLYAEGESIYKNSR
jgi:uncharacterized protein YuzE